VPHRLGQFAFNTTLIDDATRGFEDFVAIPDLVAGMLSEVCSTLSGRDGWHDGAQLELANGQISRKSDLIANWFWYAAPTLRRSCILIDRVASGTLGVRQLRVL